MLKLGRLVSLLGAAVLLPLPASTISAQDASACAYEEPAWSPDGNSLLFSSNRTGNFDIDSVRRSGRDLQRLTNHPASDAAAAWSPDGRLIVLDSDREGASTLYLMNGRGNDVRLLSADLGRASAPVWSPDGRTILFEGRYGGNRDLFRVDANGRNVERLTTDAANDFRPAPSPNGEWIAFQSKRSGTYQIHRMVSDGATVEQLTHGASNSASPSWSPDGRRVAFMSDRSGNEDIYVITLGDTSVARLTTDPRADRAPRWSPDGRDIAFLSNRAGRPGLYLMSSDGSKQVLVIEGCADPTGGDHAQNRTTDLVLSLLPREARRGASVVMRNGEGETMVRSGSGSFLCVIDANNAARLSLNCHDRRLIPLLHMEREVGAAGLRGAAFREELCTRVEAEAADSPTGLLEISASVGITSEGQLADSMTVYHLLYTPNETSASLGLRDDDPGAGAPWLHHAGSCNAHVMWSERRATGDG